MDTPPPNEPKSKRKVTWATLAVIMCALTVALPFAGRAAYHRYHAYRATEIANEANALLKDERWEAAIQVIQKEYKTYGKDPPVMRAMATLFLDGYDDAVMGSNLLRQVLANGVGTHEDISKLAGAMLKLGDTPEAQRLYESLPPAVQGQRLGLELLASIQRQQGQTELAEKTLRKALTLDPDDGRSQFRLALLDEAGSFEVSKAVGSESVWNTARRNDTLALEAVNHLCSSRSLTAPQAQELLTLVEQNSKATPRDRYRVLSAYVRLRPLEKDAVIAAEVTRNKGLGSDKIFDFLRWLGTQKEYQRIINLVTVNAALHDPDVFLVYVDALSAAERWKELLDLAEEPKVPVSESARHYISAESLSHLKPGLTEASQHIEKTYAFAGPADQQIVVKAATLAEIKGLNELAITGYLKVADIRPNLRVSLLEKVVELDLREKNVPAMVAMLKRLRELRPGNRNYIDYLNYLRLVTGDEIEIACEAVIGFDKPAPRAGDSPMVPQSLLRALVALRMGDADGMAAAVKTLTPSPRMSAGQRAVVAGLIAATGDDVTAFRQAETIQRALLLPDEMVFFNRAIK